MIESQPKTGSQGLWSVVVSSCDRFSDLWPVFFRFFFHYFPHAPQPVRLVANFRRYVDPRVKTIQVGEDRFWSDNTRAALADVTTPLVLYLQEDYLLTDPADAAGLDRLARFLTARNGTYLRLVPQQVNYRPCEEKDVIEISLDNQWMVHLQAALWDTRRFLAMLKPHLNPWQTESSLNRQAKQRQRGFFALDQKAPSVLPYLEAVRGGFWLTRGVDHCRKHGVPINLRRRPCPPDGRSWSQKLYRSLLKRRMKLSWRWEIGFQQKRDAVVYPLP